MGNHGPRVLPLLMRLNKQRRFRRITKEVPMTKLILITGLLLASTVAMSAPTKYCNPEKSKPCGNACISLTKQCRTPWTTAVSGIRPASEKGKSFSSPKYVEKAPVKGK